jgi:16S rRNA (guanine966-N2)-methyltransferase
MVKRKKTGKSPTGRLRIVAGNWRSRLLDVADVPGLRPTSQRIRETLFNWLSLRLPGARCLDLYAGTGALGLEALSRGAREVVFIERAAPAVATLEANVSVLEAVGATVLQMDAEVYLGRDHGEGFDIVFLDPPFGDDRLEELCRLLEQHNVLAPDALVYLEQDKSKSETELPQGWQTLKNKTAGNVRYRLVQAPPREERN